MSNWGLFLPSTNAWMIGHGGSAWGGTRREAHAKVAEIAGYEDDPGWEARRLPEAPASPAGVVHGHTSHSGKSPTYNSWSAMMGRCTSPGHRSYHRYGGRGIRVCDRWLAFENFLADMGERPSRGHSLDRYPNRDGNYEPGNVRWATRAEQARNRSDNILVEHAGERLCLQDMAEKHGIPRMRLDRRLRKGWSASDALNQPPRPAHHWITANGETLSITEWARRLGVDKSAIRHRLKSGWSEHDAVTVPPARKS